MPDETAEMRVLSEKIKALDAKVDTYHKEVKGEMVYRSDASERRQKTYITIATLIIGFLSFFGYKSVSIWIRNTIETKSEEKIEEYVTPQYINDMINLKGENAIQEAIEKMIINFDSKTKQTIIDFDNRLTVFLEEKKDSYDKIILSLNKGNIRDINGKQISSKEVTKELAQFKEDLSLIKTEDKFTFDDWMYKGLAEYNNKDYNDAIISFTEALENNPRSVNAYVMRGNSYRSLDRDVDAIEDYNNSIKINNEFVAAFSNRGYAYSKLKKYKKAIKDYRKSIEIKPEYFYSYPGLADAYLFKGDYKKVLESITKAGEAVNLKIRDKALLFYYQCIIKKILGMNTLASETKLKMILKNEFITAWEFKLIKRWVDNTQLDKIIKIYILDKTKKIELHKNL